MLGDCNAVNVAANVLTGYGNYPYLDSSWFLALADVPGVSVQHVIDAAGNQDIAFTFPSRDGVTAILVNARLLNAGTIQYEGYVRDGQQTLVMNQALARVPGYGRKGSCGAGRMRTGGVARRPACRGRTGTQSAREPSATRYPPRPDGCGGGCIA